MLGLVGNTRALATATLRDFDSLDINVPLEEVRQFLAARYEKRNEIHPRHLEEAVASIFRDHGIEALVTSYSRDGGIDVVLQNCDGSLVGVQVKRTKNRISAEQIRSFIGALFVGGYMKGIYVTTSSFQPGALKVAESASVRGTPVELVDHRGLFDLLKIVKRSPFRSFDDWNASYPDINFYAVEMPRRLESTRADGYRDTVELVGGHNPPSPFLLPKSMETLMKGIKYRLL